MLGLKASTTLIARFAPDRVECGARTGISTSPVTSASTSGEKARSAIQGVPGTGQDIDAQKIPLPGRQVPLRLPDDIRVPQDQPSQTRTTKDMPRPPNEQDQAPKGPRRAVRSKADCHPPRTEQEREAQRIHLDRAAARLQEQWSRKPRALPFPNLHELDPLNDPIGWQFGLHIGPKVPTSRTE